MTYIINKYGLQQLEAKVDAIRGVPRPTNTTQLRAYLGLLKYYGKLDCEKCFKESKKRLISSELLVHFDANKDIVITCDASQYGLEAVMSHIMEYESELPISFASRTLVLAERTIHGLRMMRNAWYSP